MGESPVGVCNVSTGRVMLQSTPGVTRYKKRRFVKTRVKWRDCFLLMHLLCIELRKTGLCRMGESVPKGDCLSDCRGVTMRTGHRGPKKSSLCLCTLGFILLRPGHVTECGH